MGQQQLAANWTITANVRNAYTSLIDMASWWFYNNHVAIKAKWTLKWTCDGVTGPANAGDATDRLTDKTKCATQAAIAAASQSYAVYTNADGVWMKITYQGATADVLKIAYSQSAGYVLAADTRQEPTATDEVPHTTLTVVGAGASLDRVMSIWVRNDGKGWRCATWRSSVLQSAITVGRTVSLASTRLVNPIFEPPYVKTHMNVMNRAQTVGTPVGGAQNGTAAVGIAARVYTDVSRTITLGGGSIELAGAAGNQQGAIEVFNDNKPAAQNGEGSPLIPIYWSGARALHTDGLYSSPIDWWCAYTTDATNVPAAGEPFPGFEPTDVPGVSGGATGVGDARANWLMAIGTAAVWPWRNAAATMEIF